MTQTHRIEIAPGLVATVTIRPAPPAPPDDLRALVLTLDQAQALADRLVPVSSASLPIGAMRGLLRAARARLERMTRADT